MQVTPSGEYTFGIEGPAADLDGNLFVVNFGKPGTIGKLPAGGTASEQFTALPEGSVGNAIRFDVTAPCSSPTTRSTTSSRSRRAATEPGVWFHSDEMNQPNDITIARDGTIYASDPNWKGREGHDLAHRESRRRNGAGPGHAGAARDGHHQRHRSQP